MNKTQKVLFGLMVDFDAVCQEHGIEYVLIGGSALGAVRHGGFIPWDDDVDILVSRDEFRKLDKAMQMQSRPDRKWVTEDNTSDFHNPLGKYFDTTTTNLFRSLLLDGSPNSSHLEIFIADPYPNDPQAQKEHNKYLWLYTELQNPYFPSANMGMPDGMLDMELLEHYQAEVRSRGLSDVLREIRGHLDHEGELCDFICQRWSYRPVVFRAEWLEDKTRMPFESASFPVGKDVISRLMVNYDENWHMLPSRSHRDIHESYENTKVPYAEHAEELLSLCDSLDYEQKLYRNKVDRRLRTAEYDKLDRNTARYKRAFLAALSKKLQAEMGSFEVPLLEEFSKAFEEYFSVQFSWRYRKYGLAAPLCDDLLESMLLTLVYESRIKDARDLLALYPGFGKRAAFDALCEDLWNLKVARYSEDVEGVRLLLGRLEGEHGVESQVDVERARVWLAVRERREISAELLEDQVKERGRLGDAEIGKYIGDAYALQGDIVEAQRRYAEVLKSSRNGMLVKDLNDRGFYRGEMVTGNTLLVLEMLGSIDAACASLGISYLTAGVVPKILRKRRFENFSTLQVYVCAEELPSLLDKMIGESEGTARSIEYLGNNPRYPFLGFSYVDASSVAFRADELSPILGRGVRVDVLAIRNGGVRLTQIDSVLEHGMASNYEPFAGAVAQTRSPWKIAAISCAKRCLAISSRTRRDDVFRELCDRYAVGHSRSLVVRDATRGYSYFKLEPGMLADIRRVRLLGFDLAIPDDIARFHNALYPLVSGERKYPPKESYYAINSPDVTYSMLLEADSGFEEHTEAAARNRSRIQQIKEVVDKRMATIDDVWEFAKRLLSSDGDDDE